MMCRPGNSILSTMETVRGKHMLTRTQCHTDDLDCRRRLSAFYRHYATLARLSPYSVDTSCIYRRCLLVYKLTISSHSFSLFFLGHCHAGWTQTGWPGKKADELTTYLSDHFTRTDARRQPLVDPRMSPPHQQTSNCFARTPHFIVILDNNKRREKKMITNNRRNRENRKTY